MYYTIYRTTNNVNGKYYIGKHKTTNPYDNYLGSGRAFEDAIRKYGKEHFTKEILFIFDNEEEMNAKEEEIVEICKTSYNLCKGGKGGFEYINSLGLNKGANNFMCKPESKVYRLQMGERLSALRTGDNREYYGNISRANIKVAQKNAIGKKRPEHSELMKEKSHLKKLQSDDKEAFRDLLSNWYLIISPEGIETKTNRLLDFCKNRGFPFTTFYKSCKQGKEIMKGKAKGWKCQKLLAP
jgi:hypothetical protein